MRWRVPNEEEEGEGTVIVGRLIRVNGVGEGVCPNCPTHLYFEFQN